MAQTVAAVASVSLRLASPVCAKAGERSGLGLPKLTPIRSASTKSLDRLAVVASAKKNDFEDVTAVATTLAGSVFAMMANAGSAAAAEEVMQIAEGSDARGLLILLVLVPALGWVGFNIFKPLLNQVNKMTGAKSVAGAVGLGALASALTAPDAEAAQEVAQLAADNRPLILLLVILPALGWVLFNIAKPALNQINKLLNENSSTPSKKK